MPGGADATIAKHSRSICKLCSFRTSLRRVNISGQTVLYAKLRIPFWLKSNRPSESLFRSGYKLLQLPFVKNHLKSVNIKDFEGKIIAVDASCWLHKALSIIMLRTGSFAR